MVFLVAGKLKEYLMAIHRNQSWLAKRLHITKGYVSVVANNKCKIPLVMIERLLLLTQMHFEDLFYFDGRIDGREFFGKQT